MYIATERLYWNADKTKIVKEGDPAAAYLFLGEGQQIDDAFAESLGLLEPPKAKTPPANKQKKAGKNK